jgi:hypothetical protein
MAAEAKKGVDTTKNPVPFDLAQYPGPEMAKTYMPKVIAAIIKKAKRPLLVVGAELFDDPIMFDKAIEIGKTGIPIAATAHSVKGFVERGYLDNVYQIGLHPLTNYMRPVRCRYLHGHLLQVRQRHVLDPQALQAGHQARVHRPVLPHQCEHDLREHGF